ncbi:MAG TPA: mucoidy inhibitor MuiA family protein [Gracilimonas sp.]|uniref:mucoidy inhibitor MuiA family protein n=1 Tax=Gracilimonas sp. TaxID=1974203 RepID=UPI002D877CC2|nr:mucoidy inhibitor MuiA family protein [Gracilimonas sp.]
MNLILAIVITSLNLTSISSDSLKTQSVIEDVTIYRQQAQIQRTSTVDLKPGKNIVVFESLSPSLLENSLQLRGDKAFTILSLTRRINYFAVKETPVIVKELQSRRDTLQKRITFLSSDLSVLERELRLLESTEKIISNQEMTAAELSQLLDLYRSRVSKLEREKISLSEKVNTYRTELNKVLAQLREYGNDQNKRFSEVIAEINSERSQSINLELQYLVFNAGWNPSYDIRGTDISAPLSISYKANIYQNTGIDWKETNVTISSANPTLNSTLPEINPVFVGFKAPRPAALKERGLNEVVVTGYSDRIEMESEMSLDAPMNLPPPAQNIQGQTSFSYRIEIPYSVPSDGKEHTLEFRREEVPANYNYSSVPKFSEQAYLTGKIMEWEELDLIPGKASIYFENTYVGATNIDPLSFDDSLQVSLGLDESIVIEREKLREFEERNFFGNKVRESHSWEISIRNTKSNPIQITLKDQIPLSQDENIEVDSNQLSGGILDNDSGIVTWNLQLDPGETKTLRLGYEIEYPKGKEITY